MSSETLPRTSPAPPLLPADIWARNGGIYLGLTPKGGTNQERPLAGKELDPSVLRTARIRSTWEPDGAFHEYVGEGHVGEWGPQGVGKTRKLLLVNLLKLRDWSAVVIDTKGALCAYTAVARATRKGHKVYVIDPFRVIEKNFPRLFAEYPEIFRSVGFNPVADLNPASPTFIDDAKALAMAIISADDARDPYWPMAAQAMVKGLTMALRLDKPGVSDSLAALRSYLGLKPQDFAAAIERDIEKFGANWPAVAASLGEFATHNPDDKELGGIRRTAKAQTDWLDSPLIREDLTKNNVINFESFKQTPCTCYLIIPPDYLVTHGAWLRLMVTAALRPMLRSVVAAPVPVLFMLDEIAQMGRMAIVEQNIAQMREFGVKLWTVWQDVQQMQDTYKDAWHRFMSTAEVKITFTSHHAETREYFSKLGDARLFKHTTYGRSVSVSEGRTWGTTASSGTSQTDGTTTGTNSGTNTGSQQGGSTSGSSAGSNHGRSLSAGISVNTGSSNGGSWSQSASASENEQNINERCVRPYEIAALDADETLIFARRGEMYRSICPQPEVLPRVREAILAVRSVIDGKPPDAPNGRVADRGPALALADSRLPPSDRVQHGLRTYQPRSAAPVDADNALAKRDR